MKIKNQMDFFERRNCTSISKSSEKDESPSFFSMSSSVKSLEIPRIETDAVTLIFLKSSSSNL